MIGEKRSAKSPISRMNRLAEDEVDQGLLEKIRKDIQKSGFPLEIEVTSILTKDGWGVVVHDYYIDEEESKPREMDVSAYKRFEASKDKRTSNYDVLRVSLVVECKKSDKPWVFYMTKKGGEFDFPTHLVKVLGKPSISHNRSFSEMWMKRTHYFLPTDQEKAVIPYEPFKGRNDRQLIFESTMQVVKATAYRMKEGRRQVESELRKTLYLMYPIIVFDGNLFAYTSAQELKASEYLQYLANYRFADRNMADLVGNMFLIDVVRKDYLPAYLGMLKKELADINHLIQ